MKHFVDASVEAEIIRLHAEGWKDPDIARFIGFTTTTVQKTRCRLNLDNNHFGDKPISKSELERIDRECLIFDSFCDGLSYDEIAGELKMSPLEVRQVIKRIPLWWAEHRNRMRTKVKILSGDDE